jgi:hypothetical protein
MECFYCKKCTYYTKKEYIYKKHLESQKHKNNTINTINENTENNNYKKIKIFACDHNKCTKFFLCKQLLTTHKKNHIINTDDKHIQLCSKLDNIEHRLTNLIKESNLQNNKLTLATIALYKIACDLKKNNLINQYDTQIMV